jgi:DNA-binding NarL/FixJ family response regulator
MMSYSEKQLIQLVVAGANDEQIACCLGLSTKEIRLRIDDLVKRLGLTGRIELIKSHHNVTTAPPTVLKSRKV